MDNGSRDATAAIGTQLSRDLPYVQLIRLDIKGRGNALRHSWNESDADVFCYMDVDLSTSLDAIHLLISAVCVDGYDLSVGSRLLPGSLVKRGIIREVISRGYNILLKWVLSVRFSDAQCGFKAV